MQQWDFNAVKLGCELLDENHSEFFELVEALLESQGYDFESSFEALYEHTKAHFAEEEELMREYSYYGIYEHESEHANLLGEMGYFLTQLKSGKRIFAKQYANHYVTEKFARHIINIDSQFAAFLSEVVKLPS